MIDEKLQRFFDSVNFDINLTSFFEGASLLEVLLDKKNNILTLRIQMEDLIPIEVFNKLYETSLSFKSAKKVKYRFEITNNDKLLSDYFNYYFDKLIIKCPMLECIDRDKIVFDNNIITINVLNKTEQKKIES